MGTRSSLVALALVHLAVQTAAAQPRYTITDLGRLPDTDRSFAVAINSSGAVLVRSENGGTTPPYRTFVWADGVQTDIGHLPGGEIFPLTRGFSLNDAGQVAGSSLGCEPCALHAFLWTGGAMQDLGSLLTNSAALAVNAAGMTVGYAWDRPSGAFRGFAYYDGTVTDLGALPGSANTVAWSVTDDGLVVGGATADAAGRIWHAAAWRNGVIEDLGTMGGVMALATRANGAGAIIGRKFIPESTGVLIQHAFVYADGTGVDLGTFGGRESLATDINAAGDVVGWAERLSGSSAFLYRNGVMIELGTLGAAASIAYAINDAGQVVGEAEAFPSGPDRAFLYENGTMYDLKTLIPEDSGWSFLIGATDINDAGQIVGWGAIGGEGHAFRLDPIPDPPE